MLTLSNTWLNTFVVSFSIIEIKILSRVVRDWYSSKHSLTRYLLLLKLSFYYNSILTIYLTSSFLIKGWLYNIFAINNWYQVSVLSVKVLWSPSKILIMVLMLELFESKFNSKLKFLIILIH